MNQSNQMAEETIPKSLLRFSLPAIVGMLVSSLYNLVDSIFVGRGVGSLALAGVTVSIPIITIFMACIMLIGMGAMGISQGAQPIIGVNPTWNRCHGDIL